MPTFYPKSLGGQVKTANRSFYGRIGIGTLGAVLLNALGDHYVDAQGTITDDQIDALSKAMNMPKDVEIVRGDKNVVYNYPDGSKQLVHTGSTPIAHEMGHSTSPFGNKYGYDWWKAYDVGTKARPITPAVYASVAASAASDAAAGKNMSKTTKALGAIAGGVTLAQAPMLIEEAQASLRGFEPVQEVLGDAAVSDYSKKVAIGYTSYLSGILSGLYANRPDGGYIKKILNAAKRR